MSRIANDTAKVSLPESWTNVINKPELDEVENRLQENITNGDTTLQNNLDTVESTLKESITTVDTNAKKSITAEKKRAEKKETELQNKFNSYTPTIDIPGIKVDNAIHADKATNDANGKNIDTTYAKIENTYNKEEVDQKVSSVYTYKGSVATKADLPKEKQTVGDVYDVKDSGINYAWNGTDWDALGMEIDLNLYAKKTDVPGIKVNNAADSEKLGGSVASDYAKKTELSENGIVDRANRIRARERPISKNANDFYIGMTETAISHYEEIANLPPEKNAYCTWTFESGSGYKRQVSYNRDNAKVWTRVAFSGNRWFSWYEFATTEDIADTTPVATIIYSAAKTAPTGFLLCDGREITAQQYPRLYAAIGTDFDPNHAKCLLPNQLTADGKPRALYGADSSAYKVGTYIEESLPNINGAIIEGLTRQIQGKGCFFENPLIQGSTVVIQGTDRSGIYFSASKTVNKNGSEDPKQWTTIDNPAYQDGANVFSNGIAVNMYIKY